MCVTDLEIVFGVGRIIEDLGTVGSRKRGGDDCSNLYQTVHTGCF